jgi:hypothetical protein
MKPNDYSSGFINCSKCNIIKPLSEFYKRDLKLESGRYRSSCKKCNRESDALNPNRHWSKREWHQSERGAEWKKEATFRRMGTTSAWYNSQLKIFGGCQICGAKPQSHRRLVIDHDHQCCPKTPTCGNCNRGLLCDRCNKVLGLIKENKNLLEKMKQYLTFDLIQNNEEDTDAS